MQHQVSLHDRDFLQQFLSHGIAPAQFHHRDHLRLAYIFLIEHGSENAYAAFREALQDFLAHHGIDPTKYHATLTQAWLLAVCHFMEVSAPVAGSEEFVDSHPVLLEPAVMFTHYSRDLIKSDGARAAFVEPDIQAIPRHPH